MCESCIVIDIFIPSGCTDLAGNLEPACLVHIAVVAPHIGVLIHGDQGKVVAVADDSINVEDLLAGHLAHDGILVLAAVHVLVPGGAALHTDQAGTVIFLSLHINPALRPSVLIVHNGSADTQLAVEVGTHGPDGAVGQQNSGGTHGGRHIHNIGNGRTGEAQHGCRLVNHAALIAMAQLAILVITPCVNHTLFGNGQHMVGTGSNSNEASTAVGEGHLHRVFTVGHQIGIIAQLAITVITPCVHCAIPAQSHGETITCYHADQIFEGPQLGRRGVLLVVGQLNRCSQHRLLTAGT